MVVFEVCRSISSRTWLAKDTVGVGLTVRGAVGQRMDGPATRWPPGARGRSTRRDPSDGDVTGRVSKGRFLPSPTAPPQGGASRLNAPASSLCGTSVARDRRMPQ